MAEPVPVVKNLEKRYENKGSLTKAVDHIHFEVERGEYIGTFAGIAFLITTGAVLALQQLSQSADNEERYRLLRKIGAKQSDMINSVLSQLIVYFGLPFLPACVSGAVIIAGIYRTLTGLDLWTRAANILFASGILIAVYGVYFTATYIRSKQILPIRS